MKLSKVLSGTAMAAVVVLTSVLVVGGATEQPASALLACTPDRTSTYAGSTYVEFTTVTAGCTWTVPSGVTSLTEVLIVAGGGGGGGGGTWAGGGGAGEVIGLSAVSVGSTVDIAVGAGGTTGNSSTCAIAGNGGSSYFVGGSGSTTAFGGGGGGPDNDGSCTPWKVATTNYIGGSNGGSGGGSGQSKYPVANSTATSTAHANGYGNNSGTYISNISGGGSRQGTGGGGASQAGGSITAVAVGSPGGKGGDGTDLFHTLISEAHQAYASSTLGQLSASRYYVAGGGSGSSSTGNSSTTAAGGLGGGGKGSNKSNSTLYSCTSGTSQTGGGGGGGGSGCVGGSGFVLIKYTTPAAVTYTVTYDANSATSGSVPSVDSYTTGGSAYTVSANSGTLVRTGYSFGGWNTLASGLGTTYAAGSGTLTTSANLTLYAKWTANSLMVTYDSQLGSAITAGSTTTGGSIAASPGTPARTGYAFTGWFVAASGGAAISFPYTHGQTSSFTLYAQWTANTLTVTYDSQGGDAVTAGSTTTGGSVTASSGTTTRSGYTFSGWFVASSGGTQISFPYTHGQTSSFTLFAQWTANLLTVTYDSQGGSAITAGSTTTGGLITASPGTPTRSGYSFTGWFAANSGGSALSFSYSHGQTSNFTLFAQWTADSQAITYDSQGGSAITAGSTTTGGLIAASPGTPTRLGYTFAGWFVAASGGTQISFPYTHGQTSSFTLYAQWSANSLTVTHDSQGGSAITSDSTSTGSSISTSPGTPTRSGYTFTGWFVASSGGTQISFPYTHGQTSSFTVYAQWSADSLVISYDSQGGTAIGNASTTTGGSIASSPGTPTRTGYEFAGWFAGASGGAAISFPYAHGQTSSFTLYAQWTANALTVTTDEQGGTAIDNTSTTTGASMSSPGTPTRTGYTFTGWFVASSGGTLITFPYAHGQTSSFTLYAQWTANSLVITYDSQLGSAITAGSTTTGGSISASPSTPTRSGYTFTGWFVASSGGTQISFPYTHGQTSSFTLYAQWAQSSLYGLGSKTKIGTITTADGVGNTFAAETATSSVSLRYPADGLPAGTVIDVYLVNDLTRAGSLIAQDGGFVISLVVAWLAADSSVPLTASGKPISMTIANTSIKAGAKTYAIVGGVVTLIGTATSDGTVTVLISEDPEIVVVNPVAEAPPSNNPTTEPVANPVSKPAASSPAASPIVPVVIPIVKIPTEIKNLVPVIPGAPSKISGILNPSKNGTIAAPKVLTPVISAKGKTLRATIAPVQLRAVPIDAPKAPAGAKIVPIGSMIVASKEAPKEAESQVLSGEAKATFGGQPIVSTLQKASDGVVLVSSGPSRIALAGFSSNSSAGLATSSSVPLEIATSSFIASTPVQVWLFSTPILLAETIVDSDGNFAVAINIPSSIPSGNHTLQIQGYAYTSSGAAEITSNIGISIAQSTGRTWSITFSPYVASISKSNQVAWTNFASGQGASVLNCSLTGVSPSKKSKANIKLFENRQISLLTMLKYNGCVNVNINAPIASSKSATLDRMWRVDVQPATSLVTFKWSHNFKIYSSTIDRKQIPQWSALVAQNSSSNLACSVTGAEPLAKSKANTQLFDKRNESLKQYLLSAGCSSVQFENPISRNEKLASRTIWKVEVKALN